MHHQPLENNMAMNYTHSDVHPWKVITHTGKVLPYPAKHDKAGKPMNDLKGYGDAMRLTPPGEVAVRV